MYSNSDIFSHPGVIAMFVIVGLLLFIFVPFMIRRARKQSKTARNYVPDLLRMSGLQQSGQSDLRGNYKGFTTLLKMGMGANYAEMTYEALKGFGGGRADFHGRNLVWQKFFIEMELPKEVSPVILKEKVGILRTDQFIMDKIAGRNIELPEAPTTSKLKRVRIFTSDSMLAEKIASDPALQTMIDNWHFTDVRVSSNKLQFVMDDNMINPTFGPNRIAKPQFIIDGLDIAARVAQIVTS
jgi:hypothetical protein